MSVGEMASREERPPYVTFHRKAVDDVIASQAAGHYVAKDVDFVHITPAYTKDIIIRKVADWFVKLEGDERNGRMRADWISNYRKQYEMWKEGQEIPLDGMPIKGWGLISPAQQETLIRLNIRTVEDAAGMNADAIRMVGMGGMDVKNKAISALQAAKDTGPLVLENANLRAKLELAATNIEALVKTVEGMQATLAKLEGNRQPEPREAEEITADDLLNDEGEPEVPLKRKPGRPPKAA